jgi:hypothetical protein
MTLQRWMTLGFAVGFLLVSAIVAHGVLDAGQDQKPQDKKPRAEGDNPFADKIVMVYEKNDPSKAGVGFLFKKPGFTLIKGIPFLTGTCLEERGDALAGFTASVPLDNIGSIVEFDDVEAYKKFAEKLAQAANE